MADVPDSKSGGSDTVRVRPPPPAPKRKSPQQGGFSFLPLWYWGSNGSGSEWDEGENATGRRFHPRSNENRELKERAMPRHATTIFSEAFHSSPTQSRKNDDRPHAKIAKISRLFPKSTVNRGLLQGGEGVLLARRMRMLCWWSKRLRCFDMVKDAFHPIVTSSFFFAGHPHPSRSAPPSPPWGRPP